MVLKHDSGLVPEACMDTAESVVQREKLYALLSTKTRTVLQTGYRCQSPHARTEKTMGSRAAKDMDTRIYKDVYSPVTLKCTQEFVWVTFHSHRALTNRQKHYH